MTREERDFWQLRSSYLVAIERLEADKARIDVALIVLRERLAEHEAKNAVLLEFANAASGTQSVGEK